MFLDSKQLLSDIKRQIAQVSQDLHLPVLNNLSQTLTQVQSEISKFVPIVENSEFIR